MIRQLHRQVRPTELAQRLFSVAYGVNQQSVKVSVRGGCLQERCGGWGKDKQQRDGATLEVSLKERNMLDHFHVADITLFTSIIPFYTEITNKTLVEVI